MISEYMQDTVEDHPDKEDRTDEPGHELKEHESIHALAVFVGGSH